MKDLSKLDFYGYTWMECFEEFYFWYNFENRMLGDEFYKKYPTFGDAVKAFDESLSRDIG